MSTLKSGSLVSYKGRTYTLRYVGPTAHGRRAKLEFLDGSKSFWCAADDVSAAPARPVGPSAARSYCANCNAAVISDANGLCPVCENSVPNNSNPANQFDEFSPGDTSDDDERRTQCGTATATAVKATPAKSAAPAREMRWLFRPTFATRMIGVLRLKVDGLETIYTTREESVPSNLDARHWRLTKTDGTAYEVLIGRNGQDHSCSCRGHRSHGHCKHVDVIKASLTRGEIK